jgi:hypothetical protein
VQAFGTEQFQVLLAAVTYPTAAAGNVEKKTVRGREGGECRNAPSRKQIEKTRNQLGRILSL